MPGSLRNQLFGTVGEFYKTVAECRYSHCIHRMFLFVFTRYQGDSAWRGLRDLGRIGHCLDGSGFRFLFQAEAGFASDLRNIYYHRWRFGYQFMFKIGDALE